jgi:DNA-binding NtrC family response regulator
VPPLRERRDDIPLLANGLLGRIAERLQTPEPRLADTTPDRLMAYDWPGNVRELENVLTQAVLRARTGVVTPDLLAFGSSPAQPVENAADAGYLLRPLDDVEEEHIQRVLDHTGGHKGRTCEILRISRPALDRKIAKYGLRVPGR